MSTQIFLSFDFALPADNRSTHVVHLQSKGEFTSCWLQSIAEKIACIPSKDLFFSFKGKVIAPNDPNPLKCGSADIIRVSLSGGLAGGKGGFGAMIRNMAKIAQQKKTQDFGACRDLHGRRLRHVNDEIRLQKWQEEKERERLEGKKPSESDSDIEEETESGIAGWHLDTPSWAEGFGKKKARVKSILKKRRKTRLCQNWLDARAPGKRGPPAGAPSHWGCPRGRECEFAHGEEELRGWGKRENESKKKEDAKRKREESLAAYIGAAEKGVDSESIQAAVLQGLKAEQKAKRQRLEEEAEISSKVLPVDLEGKQIGMRWGASWLGLLSGTLDIQESGKIEGDSEFGSACMVGVGLTEGRWYYEATLLTAGLMQIGWADHLFKGDSTTGDGVGDDVHSWAYDGMRQLKWNGAEDQTGDKGHPPEAYGKAWKAGDVVGCLLDLDAREMKFTLNGKDLGVAFENLPIAESISGTGESTEIGFFPAFSLEEGEALLINVGRSDQTKFTHPCSGYLPLASASKIFSKTGKPKESNRENKDLAMSPSKQEFKQQPSFDSQPPTSSELKLVSSAKKTDPSSSLKSEKALPSGDIRAYDLSSCNTIEDCEKLGLDVLKKELQSRGVKCGGTLQERAKRLFLVKDLSPAEIDPKLKAKEQRKRKNK
mmetsp:Transcript_12917/g.16304  ORF Transcript_12917/g.16304 Transcript_12917/m.16304 type:complete len:657 (-) Transcript_12917:288-2258(-)